MSAGESLQKRAVASVDVGGETSSTATKEHLKRTVPIRILQHRKKAWMRKLDALLQFSRSRIDQQFAACRGGDFKFSIAIEITHKRGIGARKRGANHHFIAEASCARPRERRMTDAALPRIPPVGDTSC